MADDEVTLEITVSHRFTVKREYYPKEDGEVTDEHILEVERGHIKELGIGHYLELATGEDEADVEDLKVVK